tara:strand:- start:1281 stop:1517 length:237 start_codon:yes stop_codon:yes gene_type:complete
MQDTDPISVIYRLQRYLEREQDSHSMVLVAGGVDNMPDYKYICGKIHTLDQISQELSNLLNPKEPKENEEDKITPIRS